MSTILVVDDSPMDRRIVGGLLAPKAEWSVVFAHDGKQALEYLADHAADLVLTDLQMPEMDGLELVQAIRQTYPRLPVVLMTAQGSEEIAVDALQLGAASYVPKKNLARNLVETIGHVFAAARKERSLARTLLSLTDNEFGFALPNDTSLIPPLVSYLQRSLADMQLCDDSDCLRVGVALEEALLNAFYHGNLQLSAELQDVDPNGYLELAVQRCLEAPFRDRRIHVRARLTASEATFVIRDEGPGFDLSALPDPCDPASLERPHARGIVLMKTFMDEVLFNQRGNQVTLVKRRSVTGRDRIPSEVLHETEDLDVEQVDDVTVVHLDANMADETYSGRIVQELCDLIDLGRPKKLLINMAEVENIHSFALGRLRNLSDKVKAHNGQLRLCGLQPTVAEVFCITKIHETFDIRDTEGAALADWTTT